MHIFDSTKGCLNVISVGLKRANKLEKDDLLQAGIDSRYHNPKNSKS